MPNSMEDEILRRKGIEPDRREGYAEVREDATIGRPMSRTERMKDAIKAAVRRGVRRGATRIYRNIQDDIKYNRELKAAKQQAFKEAYRSAAINAERAKAKREAFNHANIPRRRFIENPLLGNSFNNFGFPGRKNVQQKKKKKREDNNFNWNAFRL